METAEALQTPEPEKPASDYRYTEIRGELEWLIDGLESSRDVPGLGEVTDALVGKRVQGKTEYIDYSIPDVLEELNNIEEKTDDKDVIERFKRAEKLLEALGEVPHEYRIYQHDERSHYIELGVYEITEKSTAVVMRNTVFTGIWGSPIHKVKFPQKVEQCIDDLTDGYSLVEDSVCEVRPDNGGDDA